MEPCNSSPFEMSQPGITDQLVGKDPTNFANINWNSIIKSTAALSQIVFSLIQKWAVHHLTGENLLHLTGFLHLTQLFPDDSENCVANVGSRSSPVARTAPEEWQSGANQHNRRPGKPNPHFTQHWPGLTCCVSIESWIVANGLATCLPFGGKNPKLIHLLWSYELWKLFLTASLVA